MRLLPVPLGTYDELLIALKAAGIEPTITADGVLMLEAIAVVRNIDVAAIQRGPRPPAPARTLRTDLAAYGFSQPRRRASTED